MVKRYGVVSAWAGHAIAPAQDGRFVAFADYAALLAESERLKARVAELEASPVVAYLIDGNIEQGLAFDKSAADTMALANCGTVRPLALIDANKER